MSDENVALEIGGELLHIVLTAPPPRMADMRLADALVAAAAVDAVVINTSIYKACNVSLSQI